MERGLDKRIEGKRRVRDDGILPRPVWDFMEHCVGEKEKKMGRSWIFWIRTTFAKGKMISKRAQKGIERKDYYMLAMCQCACFLTSISVLHLLNKN